VASFAARSVVIVASFAAKIRNRRVLRSSDAIATTPVPSFVVVVVGDAGCNKFGFRGGVKIWRGRSLPSTLFGSSFESVTPSP
jgi:hypothetical protein